MTSISLINYNSPLGNILLQILGDRCAQIKFAPTAKSSANHISKTYGKQIKAILAWLDAYFAGRKPTGYPCLDGEGTVFQKCVWRELCAIPYGSTLTYAELAYKLTGSRNYARAIGQAVGKNPWAIIVPCHRVIAKNGLGGYAYGLDKKKELLAWESRTP